MKSWLYFEKYIGYFIEKWGLKPLCNDNISSRESLCDCPRKDPESQIIAMFLVNFYTFKKVHGEIFECVMDFCTVFI